MPLLCDNTEGKLSLLEWIRCGVQPTEFTPNTITHVLMIVQIALTALAAFEGFVGLGMAAFQYFTAFGDEAKATQAKKTLTWVIVGMVVIVLSSVMVYEVRRLVTGSNPPDINFPQLGPV